MSLAHIEAMPEDQFNYRATDSAMTLAEHMLHTAQGMYGLVANSTGQTNPYAQKNPVKESELHRKAEVLRIITESYDFALEGIGGMDPASFDEVITCGPFNVTLIDWVYKAKEHNTHHTDQAAILPVFTRNKTSGL